MLITTGKPAPAELPTFDLKLPEQFVVEPGWTVELPKGNVARIFEYHWPVDDKSEILLKGYRIEYVGPSFPGPGRKEVPRLRLSHDVQRHIVAKAEELLRTGVSEAEDDEDDVPSSRKKGY